MGQTAVIDTKKPRSVLPRQRARARSARGLAMASGLGFVAGAVFWHLMGFWLFVNDVVFNRRGETVERAAPARSASRDGAAKRVTGAELCSEATLDRATGEVGLAVCSAKVKFSPSRGAGLAQSHDAAAKADVTEPTGLSGAAPATLASPAVVTPSDSSIPVAVSAPNAAPTPAPALSVQAPPPSTGAPSVGGWSARIEKVDAPAAAVGAPRRN